MKGFKKFSSVLCAGLLLLGMSAPAARAAGDTNIIIGQINFIDVHADSWANDAVTYMAKSGVINGYEDHTFRPDNPVSREEFATLIAKTFYLDLPLTASSTFYDVQPDRWSAKYIEASKDYLTGYYPPNGHAFFNPELNATREDVAVALVKTLGYTVDDLQDPDILSRFSDEDAISPNLRDYVALAIEKKLFSGYPDGTFHADQPVSRAEVASLLYRILKTATTDGQTDIQLSVSVPEKTNESTIYVEGTVTKGAKVTINNEDVDVVQGKFKAGYLLDKEGTYDITVVARLNGGKSKTVTKHVTYERSGPVIQLDPIPETTDKGTLTVTGTVTDSSSDDYTYEYPEVYLNDKRISNGWSSEFDTDVTLQEGDNTLVFKATDSAGKTTTVEKHVLYTAGGPAFQLGYIPETTSNATLSLDFTVTDPNDSAPNVYLNDELLSSWSNRFTKSVTLEDGENTLNFVAVNKNGKQTRVTKTVTLNGGAPVLKVDPIPATATSATLTVRWTVTDANDSNPQVYVNDELTDSWYHQKTLTLQPGDNTITFRAVNKFGKTTTVTKTVSFAPNGPKLNLDYVPDTTGSKTLRLSWTVTDANDTDPKVYVNDELTDSWNHQKTLTLQPGSNTITVRATDKLGQSATVTKTIVFTPAAPQLTVDPLPDTTTASTIRVSWHVSDANDSSPHVYVNDEAIDWSTSKTVTLQDGVNTIVIRATNSLGQVTTVTKTITKGAQPSTTDTPAQPTQQQETT